MRISTKLLTTTIAATALCFGTSVAAQEAFAPTTPERLLNADAEPHNWLMNLGNYSNWHYSGLDQVNRDNVANLRLVYTVALGGCTTPLDGDLNSRCNEQSAPLVENGIMYVNDGLNRVMAFDVSSGDRAVPLWHFDPETQTVGRQRGIALFENTLISVTGDARFIAVDKQSGELVWEVGAQEPLDQPNTAAMIGTRGFTDVRAYETAGGRQIIVPAIRGRGVGYMAAYDANDGELIWRTNTIPQEGEANFGSWPTTAGLDSWKTGRAMPWGPPPAFDPETNLLYFGTGEPSPVYDPEFRAGDNLYSASTIAVDADTGALAWFFQEIPNDQWDGDSTSSRMLYEGVVSNWGRMGFFYQLDSVTGEFINGTAQTDNITWTAGLDPKTGKPIEYNPNVGLQDYAGVGPRRARSAEDALLTCTSHRGAPTGVWSAAYDPTTGVTYQSRTVACMFYSIVQVTEEDFNPLGGEHLGGRSELVMIDATWQLIAIDTANGEVNRLVHDLGIPDRYLAEVGVLATAGGIVFTGGEDGRVSAHHSETLEELWGFNTGTHLKGGVVSFAVDGKQYIAKIVGGDGGAGATGHFPTSMLYVWTL